MLLDSLKIYITLSPSGNSEYEMPYTALDDNGSTAYLCLVNDSEQTGTVSILNYLNNDNASPVDYFLESKKIKFIPLMDSSKLKLISENILFAPFIVLFDENYNVSANIIPSNVRIKDKELILPLLIQSNDLGNSKVYINNFSSSENTVALTLYSYTGSKIFENNYTIEANGYQIIEIPSLIESDTSGIYWIKATGDKDLSIYSINSILNSYINIYGFSLNH